MSRARAFGSATLRPLGIAVLLSTTPDARAAQAQHAATTPADFRTTPHPFATSLQIAPPGPQPESNGLSYHFMLTWSPRPDAGAYRVFMWTDAARTWYRVSQTTSTTTDAHAFRSGCTAFVVVAFTDASAPRSSTRGLEASHVLRFPLSQRPNLCPMQPP